MSAPGAATDRGALATRLVLEELDRTGVRVRLDSEVAAALAATKLVEVRTQGGGVWRLLPAGRVGAVHIGGSPGLDVQVLPKIGISRLLFLLGYATDPGFRPEDVPAQAEPDLWPALAESLARSTERALLRGVRQGYVTVEESLAVVRGRIRVADQIARRRGVLLPLEVRFDEYSPDIAENQILRSACRLMSGLGRVTPALRRRLRHLDARLEGVSVLHPGQRLPAWIATRANAPFVPAVRLAEIILRNQSAEAAAGTLTMAAFVVSMQKAYEDFLLTALQEALASRPGSTRGQYPIHLDTARDVRMRPDVVHIHNGRPVAVFDAKYKLEDPSSGYPNADVYQMLAYCTALRLRRGWLVYAHGIHNGPVRVAHSDIEIVPYPLDLSHPPQQILAQIDALATAAIPVPLPA